MLRRGALVSQAIRLLPPFSFKTLAWLTGFEDPKLGNLQGKDTKGYSGLADGVPYIPQQSNLVPVHLATLRKLTQDPMAENTLC